MMNQTKESRSNCFKGIMNKTEMEINKDMRRKNQGSASIRRKLKKTLVVTSPASHRPCQ